MGKKGWQRSRLVPVVWATALLYAPLAQALGLGRLTVESNLGEPLRAEIPLLAFHAADRHSVHARLASTAAFAAAGIRKSRTLRSIRCDIRRNAQGRYVVLLKSGSPVDVPFLHFLLSLKWSSGSLLHEYTALLNPSSGVTSLGSAGGAQALPLHVRRAPTRPIYQPAYRPTRRAATVRHRASTTGPIRSGETLWVVALHVAPSAQAMPQTLAAFLHENPSAFFRHNVNDLRAGAILRIPTRRQILTTSAPTAERWLAAQDGAWARYKAELANSPAIAAGHSHGISGTVRTVRVLPANQEALRIEATKTTAGVAPGAKGHGVPKGTPPALAARMMRIQKELQKTRHLMMLEDQELAVLQNQAHKAALAHHAAVVGGLHKAQPAPVAHSVKPIAHGAKVVRPVVAKPAAIKHPVAPVMVPPVAPAPSFFSTLLSSERLPILGALLVIVIGGGALLIQRRRRTMAEFEESILSGGGLNSEGQMPDTAGLPKTPDVSFLSEFSQVGGGGVHTDEVDPLAEADVYLAYGRDEQAEEILKEAVLKDPARIELKLKLLEIYFQRNDTKAFEIIAEEVYAASSGRGSSWQKVEEMGRKLDPANPLFKQGGSSSQGAGGADDEAPRAHGLSDRIDFAAVARELAEVSSPQAVTSMSDGGGLEWTSGAGIGGGKPAPDATASDAGSADSDEQDLDFSLDFTADSSGAATDSGAQTTPLATSNSGASHSLDFEWAGSAPEADAKTTDGSGDEFALQFDDTELASFSATDLDVKEGRPSFGKADGTSGLFDNGSESAAEEGDLLIEAEIQNGDGDGDAVETKLDLARAYLEMGDSEAARGILEEVGSEGTPAQKALAESMLAGIA